MTETWRVIDESGVEHEATVEVHDDYDRSDLAVTMCGRRGIYHGATLVAWGRVVIARCVSEWEAT
jgi:hypothetical protein